MPLNGFNGKRVASQCDPFVCRHRGVIYSQSVYITRWWRKLYGITQQKQREVSAPNLRHSHSQLRLFLLIPSDYKRILFHNSRTRPIPIHLEVYPNLFIIAVFYLSTWIRIALYVSMSSSWQSICRAALAHVEILFVFCLPAVYANSRKSMHNLQSAERERWKKVCVMWDRTVLNQACNSRSTCRVL